MGRKTIKRTVWSLILGALVVSVALRADEPSRRCVYNGQWSYTDASQGSGPIQWNIVEIEECCGIWALRLEGDGADEYGSYRLDGSCAEGQCSIHQKYVSGQLEGRAYTYTGEISWKVMLSEMSGLNGKWGEDGQGTKGNFQITNMSCS